MPRPALVILAAGMGSRFGGPKQLTPVGPAGETLLDYSASAATGAGFGPVVIVTRSELAARLGTHVGTWPISPIVVYQDLDGRAVRARRGGRTNPLGTVHAALSAMAVVPDTPVAVVNGDDLYDPETYRLLADHLTETTAPDCALVTYPVNATLVSDRPVSRALCEIGSGGWLRAVEEGTVTGAAWVGRSGRRVTLRGDEPVSMNCWGLPATIASRFTEALDHAETAGELADELELGLPDVIGSDIADGTRVRAISTSGRCVGITYPEDVDLVRAKVARAAWGRAIG